MMIVAMVVTMGLATAIQGIPSLIAPINEDHRSKKGDWVRFHTRRLRLDSLLLRSHHTISRPGIDTVYGIVESLEANRHPRLF